MKAGYVASGTVCPCYKCETRQKISCVGTDGMHLHITFAQASQKRSHKERYCNKCFERCKLFRAMEKDV